MGIETIKPILEHPNRITEPMNIATDFMGTMNGPDSKKIVFQTIYDNIKSGNTKSLLESGFTQEQLSLFKEYINHKDPTPMELREKMFSFVPENASKVLGKYTSIGAEIGELDDCQVYPDAVDFLALNYLLGHNVSIYSTIIPPEGYKSMQEVLLERFELPNDLKKATGKANALELLTGEIIGDKRKKTEPGEAIFEYAKRNELKVYLDDEVEIINSIAKVFTKVNDVHELLGRQKQCYLSILAFINRDKKNFKIPNYFSGIGILGRFESLTDMQLLHWIYLK